jgi:hypothetical protein
VSSDGFGEIEGVDEDGSVEECGEKCEDREEMELGYAEQFRRVEIVPVAKLVS